MAYDTPLSPDEEAQFQAWATRTGKLRDTEDYDLRGAWKAGIAQAPNGHLPDTWKKPNHPTFSDQSQYSTADNPGGKWTDLPGGRYEFSASPQNMRNLGAPALKDYFTQREPGNSLVVPPPWNPSAGIPQMPVPGQPLNPQEQAAYQAYVSRMMRQNAPQGPMAMAPSMGGPPMPGGPPPPSAGPPLGPPGATMPAPLGGPPMAAQTGPPAGPPGLQGPMPGAPMPAPVPGMAAAPTAQTPPGAAPLGQVPGAAPNLGQTPQGATMLDFVRNLLGMGATPGAPGAPGAPPMPPTQ